MELIGIYCEDDRNTLLHGVVKGRFRHVTADGTYSNHWALNGCHFPEAPRTGTSLIRTVNRRAEV
jgi:hypothetical protein